MRLQVRSAQRNAELNGYSEDAFRVLQCGQSLEDDEPVQQVRGGGRLMRVQCDAWWGGVGEVCAAGICCGAVYPGFALKLVMQDGGQVDVLVYTT